MDPIREHLHRHLDELTDRLAEWVAIPSIAGDAEHQGDLRRSAHWLAGEMRAAGLEASVLESGDSWAVLGEYSAGPEAPTALVYSHHDVRTVKPEEWAETEPFIPVRRDGRLYGRGASDAKGQALAHVWALRALRDLDGGAPMNVKLLIEGEEETGSPTLAALLEKHAERLACDVIVFSDTVQWKADAPAPVTSMRGTVNATLTVRGPDRDVHSGVVAGTTVNPAITLAHALAALHDEQGRVRVPGFYDGVAELTDERRSEFAALPFDEHDWVVRTETRVVNGEEGFTVLERLWARPTVEVMSLIAGDPLGLPRSVIPRDATANLSIRTVADQRIPAVAEQLRGFFASVLPAEAEYSLVIDEAVGQEPYESPSGPLLGALERALERGYDLPVRGRMGNAGGGPADLLTRTFDAPILFLGTGLPEDHWHSSDESIDLRMLHSGAASIAHLWRELAEVLSARP
ncbi:M20/M25/M40 family metallo-hydrolase [Microbacterium esteraromaticum]|uniref:M20/M25/M40 family metallo-hydrolase n=1 Tax=Microbacterium esteraromaticum TaxID=57043 RepID=UPI00195DFFE0|nr:M20/M25/M40 family metallo-hydrolase [Microbacterium esteraromaticum]MBM7466568.1 acetylornithine deacetylase/succinyl-diaminopimelate desuccinylase-like protein [Microbacterium esteraromaticum]